MPGFRSTLCSYSSGETKLLEILENQGGLWNKAAGKVFVVKGNNINVGKAGISCVGNTEPLWARASSTHSHRLALLHQLHCPKAMPGALVAHPEITIMHKFSWLKNSIKFYSLRYFLALSYFCWHTASVLCTRQNAPHTFLRQEHENTNLQHCVLSPTVFN